MEVEAISGLRREFENGGMKAYLEKRIALNLEQIGAGRKPSPIIMSHYYVLLGDRESAVKWLEEGYRQRQSLMIAINVLPIYDTLREKARFQNLVSRVGLSNQPSAVQ